MRAGLSTGPNDLADKNDIYAMKKDLMAPITNMVIEQGDKISALKTRMNVLEAKNAMLESHIAQLQSNQESQEQYSLRLCLRIDEKRSPANGNQKSSDDVLEKVENVFTEIGVEVPDAVIDRAHRIGPKSFADGKANNKSLCD